MANNNTQSTSDKMRGFLNPNLTHYQEVPLVNSLNIRDVNGIMSETIVDIKDATHFWLDINNTLDQPCTLTIEEGQTTGTGTEPIQYENADGTSAGAPAFQITAGAHTVWGPFKAGAFVAVYLQCSTAPTSGNISVTVRKKQI